jgi:hypothetical protein
MKFKIPVRINVSVVIGVEAKNLNDACMRAMESDCLKKGPVSAMFRGDEIPIIDNGRLEEMYPAETKKMREDAMPYWEKKGWHEDGVNQWSKGNARIENTFDDVGWGFQGTVWIGSDGKSGFTSLESAIDWAESKM